MKTLGAMYKCDMCRHEQFVSIEEQNDGLLKVGIHKFELAGSSELKYICHDCYTALIHFIRVEHKECGVPKMVKSDEDHIIPEPYIDPDEFEYYEDVDVKKILKRQNGEKE